MAKQLTEDELNIRRKARRRLTGAIALTLAVVVILPMVLDSEPKPSGQDIDLRIPAADKAGEFIPGVATPAVAEAMPMAASAVAPNTAPVAASVVPPAPVAPAVSSVAPAETVKPAAPAPAVRATAAAAPVKEAAAGNSRTEASGKATSATTTDEPKGAEKPAAAESFAVQIGAYSNAETAKQELLKLKKWGFKAYTEKAGAKIRVRVGPYTERDKVDKARQLLEKHGLHPVVVSAR